MVKFYRCEHCGNIIIKLHDSQVPVFCCGEKMQELIANHSDAAVEKHVPIVATKHDKVLIQVGSNMHPMTAEHYIEWVYVETIHGGVIQYLQPEEKAEIIYSGKQEEIKTVYAYCNLHGLWKVENEK